RASSSGPTRGLSRTYIHLFEGYDFANGPVRPCVRRFEVWSRQMSSQPTVFIVDHDAAARVALCRLMEGHALAAEGFASAEEFLAAVREDRPGCLVLDLRLPGMNGLALQDQLSERDIALPIIFISACGTVATAVQAVK